MGKSDKTSTKTSKGSKNDSDKNTMSSDSAPVSSGKTTVYRYNKVDFQNVNLTDLNKEGTQGVSFINYTNSSGKEEKLIVQTGNIKLTNGGIPQIHPKYCKEDKDREYIKIPFDPEQESCMELKQFLDRADEHFGSEQVKEKLFGKSKSKYLYQPCVRSPGTADEDDEEDNEKGKSSKKSGKDDKKYPKMEFCKIKFNIKIDKNTEEREVITRVDKVPDLKNRKQKTRVKVSTMTDVAKEIKFLSTVRLVFYFSKIWVMKTPPMGSKFLSYGLGFKVMAIEYTPSATRGVDADNIEFLSEEDNDEVPSKETKGKQSKGPKLDSDDEESADEKPVDKKKASPAKKDTQKKESKKVVKDETDSDDDSDDEPKKSSKSAPAKKGTKEMKKDTDSDESDDESKKPSKSAPVKKGAKQDSDSDDDSDDEPKKSKKATPNKKAPAKKNTPAPKKSKKIDSDDSDDSDDDDSEEEVAKPKSKKSSAGKSK